MDSDAAILERPLPASEARPIGRVVSISGYRCSCLLTERGADAELTAYREAQIGSIVKIETEKGTATFGFINSVGLQIANAQGGGHAVAEIELFGEIRGGAGGEAPRFTRGVSVYPVLGATVAAASHADMAVIYARPDSWHLEIGRLYQDDNQPAYLVSQEFLCKHSAILGTTGSGKSCAVTLILRELLKAHPNGHVLLIDPHGEYAPAFNDMCELVTTQNLQLPYWLLTFEEICEVMCSRDPISRSRESGILKDIIVAAKREFAGNAPNAPLITVDTPVPYRLSGLMQRLTDGMGKLDKADGSIFYLRLITQLEALQADRRYAFMFGGGLTVRDNLAQIVSRLLRIPVEGKPVTILDVSAIPSEIMNVVVSLLCRLVFDFALWSDREVSVPVLLVCDEAHRYVPADEASGFEPTRRAMGRIAKEGRKYGVSLCLVSQRPSEISESVLSQCSTVFALRMASDKDLSFVRGTLPENASALLNTLPALRHQEAIVIGEGVTHPMRIRFRDLDAQFRPQSASANFPVAWEIDHDLEGFVTAVVERWRRQQR